VTTTARRLLGVMLIGALALAACGGDDSDGTPGAAKGQSTGATLRVPGDYATIQAAVDDAEPGDLILVGPGTYKEAVTVETDELTIRGTDRNEVILDGGFELDTGLRVVGADGVAAENMTARNYAAIGFYWTGVEGYRGSYLTTYRTGDYGIYAFDSTKGLVEHSYASGSPEGGFYVGQCFPCDAVIDDVVSEYNGLGYSGTNSGGDLYIVNSTFRYNRAGIVPNSGSYELCYPQREVTIVGNLVYSNNQPDTPATSTALRLMGNGILPTGGTNNLIEHNLVYDHERTGIGLVPRVEQDPNDDIPSTDDDDRPCSEARQDPPADPSDVPHPLRWNSRDNRVVGNVVSGSGWADLSVGTIDADGSELHNCFADNQFASSAPADLEALAPCDGEGGGDWSAGALDVAALIGTQRPPARDYKVAPVPAEHESMPDAESAPARPATDGPPEVDVEAIEVPQRPS